MKIIDNMPIIIIVTSLLINIAIGVNNSVGFSELMIRCIVVTIVFGVFGYMLTETVKSTIECSSLSKHTHDKGKAAAELGKNLNENNNNSVFDIKVPPLDDEEFISIDNGSDNGFVEVNPVYMGKRYQNEQD